MYSRLSRKFAFRIIFFNILIILLLTVWVGLSLIFANWILSYGNDNYRLLLPAIIPIVYALFSVIFVATYSPPKSRGISVTKEMAPQLFSLITDVAGKVKYNSPIDEVILTPGTSVSVNLNPNLYNFIFGSKAKLYIGVAACRFLSVSELSAVIAHELSHFVQPETKYKAYLARVVNISSELKVGGLLNSSNDSNIAIGGVYALPARFFGYIFKSLFNGVCNISSNDYSEITVNMELEADRMSAKCIGASYMLSALCKSHAISNRIRFYKSLILPYFSSCNYRCDGFWDTFENANILFEKIDSLDIRSDKLLLDLDLINESSSDDILVSRLKALRQMSDCNISDSIKLSAKDMIPKTIQNKMDKFLCRKYGQQSGIPVSQLRLQKILEEMRVVLFSDVHSMPCALQLIEELLAEARLKANIVTPTFMPEQVQPSIDLGYSTIIKQPTETIYSSSMDKCPVCGHTVNEEAMICPHCHEIIAE